MEIVVGSKHLVTDVAVALDVQGREHLVVATKATWSIPDEGARPKPQEPEALCQTDVYLGEPGVSAMIYGSDFARYKAACDVLFDSQCHAPRGEPVPELVAAWQVGSLRKSLRVIGARTWKRSFGMMKLSAPEPFTGMPLHFGMAFGGARTYVDGKGDQKQELCEALLENPVGLGFAGEHTADQADGAPAHHLESPDVAVTRPTQKAQPAAFSAVARHWSPRKDFAGTYDEAWQREVFPLLPHDFDERFHQCAPADQQMPYPVGGEEVVLRNMMAKRPLARFRLPALDRLGLRILRTDYTEEVLRPVVDTLFFETERQRFSVVWRASTPIRRRIQEFQTLAVGPIDMAWWRRKSLGLVDAPCADCGPASLPKAA